MMHKEMTNEQIKIDINMQFNAIEYAGRLGEDQERLRIQYQDLSDFCSSYLLKDDLNVFQRQYAQTIKNACSFSIFFMDLSPEAKAKFDDLQDRSLGIYRSRKK